MELRRTTPAATVPLWQRFRDAQGLPLLLLGMLFFLAAAVMDIWPINPLRYREGMYVTEDIYARVDFSLLDETALPRKEREIRETTPAVFTLNQEQVDKFLAALRAFPDTIDSYKALTQPSSLPDDVKDPWLIEDETVLDAWRRIAANRRHYDRTLDQLRQKLIDTPLVDPDVATEQRNRLVGSTGGLVTLIYRKGEQELEVDVPANRLISLKDSSPLSSQVDSWLIDFDDEIRPGIRKQVMQWLEQPVYLYLYDALATRGRIDQAIEYLHAHPPLIVKNQGNQLVPRNTTIRGPQLRLLEAEHDKWQAQSNAKLRHVIGHVASRCGVVLLFTALMFAYIFRYERDLLRDVGRGLSAVLIMLAVLGINKAVMFTAWNERVAVMSVMLGTVILCIGYNQRLALMVAILLSLMAAHQLRLDSSHMLILMAGATSMVLQLRDIRSRSRLIEVSAVSAVIVLLSALSVLVSAGLPFQKAILIALWAAGAALLVGFVVQGLLPFIEKIFRVATSMTLLEWTDPSKPLLRRLAMEAPGTFNHSLQLGMMCEAAAEAIGARGLLARAGAYYHDIGKINKPEYFVENQAGAPNPHQKLSPAMSLLIIIGHVKDGLEMAREYHLPDVLREFIVAHHGTTLVQYFYHAATEQRKADTDRAPDEVEFRYPGPKPRTKEAAILMLADASESSVRAMPDPTPGRIETQVNAMVERRLMDGQLDDCELTLREVHQIEASIIRSLNAMYHGRIAYPKPAGKKAAPSESDGEEKSAADGEKPATEKPTPDKPAAEKDTPEKPDEKPVGEKPANEKPVSEKINGEKPTGDPAANGKDSAAEARQRLADKIQQSEDQ